jgi:hypothetical protein
MAPPPACTLRVLALTTQCDPFPRISIDVDRFSQEVIGLAIAHIYAMHGLRVTRHQVLVERTAPFTHPPSLFGG